MTLCGLSQSYFSLCGTRANPTAGVVIMGPALRPLSHGLHMHCTCPVADHEKLCKKAENLRTIPLGFPMGSSETLLFTSSLLSLFLCSSSGPPQRMSGQLSPQPEAGRVSGSQTQSDGRTCLRSQVLLRTCPQVVRPTTFLMPVPSVTSSSKL